MVLCRGRDWACWQMKHHHLDELGRFVLCTIREVVFMICKAETRGCWREGAHASGLLHHQAPVRRHDMTVGRTGARTDYPIAYIGSFTQFLIFKAAALGSNLVAYTAVCILLFFLSPI